MDADDILILARTQFGLNISFHILFPSITLALAWFLVYFRVKYARTRSPEWLATYKLWVKIFALTFAMGVVSGIVMSFQFGTNWPGFMNEVGNVAGPLLAYEVLTAFFLEATFLGVMLFGMNRVPNWMHITSTVLVAVGTTLSAFWILALNSWMQTPAGIAIADGQIIAGDWWSVIFNPSFPYRFTHMMLAYVVLDGYDLGVGMLMPAANEREQDVMVASIGPFWDANETWLVLGVGLLLVAFPIAHGVILGALYLQVAAMLIGLMLRGVAFEFRIKAEGWHRELWNWLFWLGSFLASLAQGLMLGSYITGFETGFGYYLFSLVVAGGVCGGYVLLGATWLILRTEGGLQKKAVGWTRWGLMWVALGVALVSLATPLASETVRAKWFDFPRTLELMLLPLASAAAWLWVWRLTGRLKKGESAPEWGPFAGTVAIYVLAFLGLAYSLFPYVVMDRITIWEAAAHPSSLKVVLAGALIVLPFIIGYTVFSYRVFRGKARDRLYE